MPKVSKIKGTSAKDTPYSRHSSKASPRPKRQQLEQQKWNLQYEQLKQFKQVNGHCNVSTRNEEYNKLGAWVQTQRTFYRKNKLLPERIEQLNGIGFEWGLKKGWNEILEELKQFKQVNGHCNVSQYDKANPQLGSWVGTQRQMYKNNKLLPERIEQLNGIGFEWVRSTATSVSRVSQKGGWNERLEELKQYKQVNGHCNVSTYDEANSKLGSWVKFQRQMYKKNKLLPERIELLSKIGFEWELQSKGWNERLEELKQFKQVNGHCNVSTCDKTNPQLGWWVSSQRQFYKKNKLLPERIELLSKIGFVWETRPYNNPRHEPELPPPALPSTGSIPHRHQKTTIEYQQETERESFKILLAMKTKPVEPPQPSPVLPEVQGPRDKLQKESPAVQEDQQPNGSDDIDILLQQAAANADRAGFDVSQYAAALKREWLTIDKLRGKDVEYLKRHSGNMPVVLAEEVQKLLMLPPLMEKV